MTSHTTSIVVAKVQPPERPPVQKDMRAARGLLVGLALAAIIWLSLLVARLVI